MGWQDEVATAFLEQGVVGRLFEGYVPRNGQILMAREVALAIERGDQLVVQAGTGIGKSYAYLVPVLLSGKRAVIATGTKALQDQLALRDIPKLLHALNSPLKVVALKGRSSYLCLERLNNVSALAAALDLPTVQELRMVQQWAGATVSGDIAEIHSLRERSPIVPLITSTSDSCLGTACTRWSHCHVNAARDAAFNADVVVTNHHLFFADAALDVGLPEGLLPRTDVVVFDEAHRLPDVGIDALAMVISIRALDQFCADLASQSSTLVLGAAHWREWREQIQVAIGPCRRVPDPKLDGGELSQVAADQSAEAVLWLPVTRQLHQALLPLERLLGQLAESSPVIAELHLQAARWADLLAKFVQSAKPGDARWIEFGSSARLVQGTVNIAGKMQAVMAAKASNSTTKTAWLFTSATLGRDPGLTWFTDACGLGQAKVIKIESPFDYGRQAALYIPEHFPLPHEELHSSEVALLVAQGATLLGGRTLVLTTSLRAMHGIAEALRKHLRLAGEINVLVQGEASKRELIQQFSVAASGRSGAVLVASATFWEGVDIAGPALQMVVIDKIPFAPPNDPIVQVRTSELQRQGKNAFAHFQLEHAALGLMQGAGRLIRGEDDCGVLVVCDGRLLSKGYGKKLIAALPPMARLNAHRDFVDRLRQITTPSTMDHDWI